MSVRGRQPAARNRVQTWAAASLFPVLLLLLIILGAAPARASSYLVRWDPPVGEPPATTRYFVYYSTVPGVFSEIHRVYAGTAESLVLDLPCVSGSPYYFAVRAVDRASNPGALAVELPCFLATGPGPGMHSSDLACLFEAGGDHDFLGEIAAYGGDGWPRGLRLACGNVSGGQDEELVVAPGPGTLGPRIRVYQGDGTLISGGAFLAFSYGSKGATVACGDLDGDGQEEIVVGAGPGPNYGPSVRAYRRSGASFALISGVNFLAFPASQGYGVKVACGDVDGDGRDEIVAGCGPGPGLASRVRVFRYTGTGVEQLPGADFLAYGASSHGVNVACGCIDGDGYDEILTGPGPARGLRSQVRVFHLDGDQGPPVPGVTFFAYATPDWGVEVAAADLDDDCFDEVLTGPGPGPLYGSQLRGFRLAGGQAQAIPGFDFFPYAGTEDEGFGVHAAAGKLRLD